MELQWYANWIWYPGMRQKPNFYFYARKSFMISNAFDKAELSISAYTDYILYINGVYVGRGPSPSNAKCLYFYTYNISDMLTKGINTIAILVHNYAVGVHWNPASPGGLIVQAEIHTGNSTKCIITDESWKVKKAECYDPCSPRMMFSCRYLETFHMNLYNVNWKTSGFDDSDWDKPEVIGKTPVFPYERLIPSPIPLLKEVYLKPVAAQKAYFTIEGFHRVSFKEIEKVGVASIYYASTNFFSEIEQTLYLLITCDDAFTAFLNGQRVLEQGYDESFVRSVLWYGREEYEQFHNSCGCRNELVKVKLLKGWNKLTVAVDQGPEGWGFAMGFIGDDLRNYRGIQFDHFAKLDFSAHCDDKQSEWMIQGPFHSSGMKNSMNHIKDDMIPGNGKKAYIYPTINEGITDYDLLMRGEIRRGFTDIGLGTDAVLDEGQCIIYDLGVLQVGYAVLDIVTSTEAVLDISICNVLSDGGKPCGMVQTRSTDRLYLTEGALHWEAVSRRDGRYIHISCRRGKGILLKSVTMKKVGYPVVSKDSFECSDALLNQIYKVSKHSTSLVMHHNYEDCLKREEGVHNGRNAIHAFTASYHAFGDSRLIKKMFLDLLATQEENGWINGAGPIDNSKDEISKALWAIEYLKLYYEYTGDVDFLTEVYDKVRCFMRYLSRLENKDILIDGKNEFNNRHGRDVWIDDHTRISSDVTDIDLILFSFNTLYFGVLNCMTVIAKAVGKKDDSEYFRKKASFLKQSFNSVFWDKNNQMYVDWVKDDKRSKEIQDAYLILALYYGICDMSKEEKVLSYLFDKDKGKLKNFTDYNFTFGFYYFILEVMYKYGMDTTAYELLRTYYGSWLKLGLTAFGEHFVLKEAEGKKSLGREFNVHLNSTSAHIHYYTHILGVIPAEPGFSKVKIAPQPGDIEWVSGSVYTPMGIVKVSWRIEKRKLNIDLLVPQNMEYEILIPNNFLKGEITIQTLQNS